MSTPIENLKRRIANLEKTHPNSRLLKDFKNQLRASEYNAANQAAVATRAEREEAAEPGAYKNKKTRNSVRPWKRDG